MAHRSDLDLVKETTSTTGTGTLTLAGAVSGFVGVCDSTNGLLADGDTGWFVARNGTEWEEFLGTRGGSGTTLARTTRIKSSTGAAVNFTSAPVVYGVVPGTVLMTNLNTRTMWQSAQTRYVATTGSDSNDGLTAGTPLLTIQRAYNLLAICDLGGYTHTISVANGTYTAGLSVTTDQVGSGQINVVGDQATPSNVLLTGGFNGVVVSARAKVLAAGVKLVMSGGAQGLLANAIGAEIFFQQIDFAAMTGGGSHIYVGNQGTVSCTGNYTISGAAAFHWVAIEGGKIYVEGKTITLTGTPGLLYAFAIARSISLISASSNTFSGSATGSRYSVERNAVIFVSGAAATYFPGHVAGSATLGGVYG